LRWRNIADCRHLVDRA